MSETRKLAAIVAADVAGSSRLTATDEERAISRLRGLRTDVIDPAISVHHGRVVKTTGDGILIEFRSVVDAVRCSIEVQNGTVERNAGLPPERQILCRVGIHLGDVIEKADGDLIGDGVNVAARLEGICEPGGVCLSSAAYEQIRDKIAVEFVDLGERSLRNIARPVKAYAIPARSKDDRTTGHGRGSTAILNAELPLNKAWNPQAAMVAAKALGPTAQRIIDTCTDVWPSKKDACNFFAIEVADRLGVSLTGVADDIVDQIRGHDWTSLTGGPAARDAASQGKFVLAGMKSSEFTIPRGEGHVAVVVVGAMNPGGWAPAGYWGSTDPIVASKGDAGNPISLCFRREDSAKITFACRDL